MILDYDMRKKKDTQKQDFVAQHKGFWDFEVRSALSET